MLLEFVNAHREDAHAKPIEGPELAALQLTVTAVEAAIEEFLAE